MMYTATFHYDDTAMTSVVYYMDIPLDAVLRMIHAVRPPWWARASYVTRIVVTDK